jgi:hypothetical protein
MMAWRVPLSLAQDSVEAGTVEESTSGGEGFLEGLSNAGANPLRSIREALDGRIDLLNHPEQLLTALHEIHLVWAVIFMVTGALCVFNGLRWHKTVIIALACLLGVWAGDMLGDRIDGAHAVSATSMALLFGILALPGLRFAVALFGGLAGAFIGANLWTALGYNPEHHAFGAILGLLILGMLAFSVFRVVIILFTSVGGAALLVFGGVAAMLENEAWAASVERSLTENHLILPMVVAVTALVGVVVQQGGGVKGLMASADKASAGAGAKQTKNA